MRVSFLSSRNYEDSSKNYGDCIIIDNNKELVIYDCGSEEHAKRVLDYMSRNNYSKVKIVLSHNDSDHYRGIEYLVDLGVVSEVYALLLLKYKDELLNLINDKRITRESLSRRIMEAYDNIKSLGGKVELKDIFENDLVASSVFILGPDKRYALAAVAKQIDSRESDTLDNETIVNAVSTQVSVSFGSNKLLLTGDSSFEAIEERIKTHNAIQLPHHGKLKQADQILAVKDNSTIYYVSDNTGDSNGGSDDLRRKHPRGYIIHNTINGNQCCNLDSFMKTGYTSSYKTTR